MILGLLAAVVLCACDSTQKVSEKKLSTSSSSHHEAGHIEPQTVPEVEIASTGEGAEHAEPRGDAEVEGEIKPVRSAASAGESVRQAEPSLPLKRIDPGAAAIASAIRHQVDSRDPEIASIAANEPIIIGLCAIRNQSRGRPAEFTAFLERFATLLSCAGETHHLSFTSDPDAETDYTIFGTAYLLSADGFDWWELFLSVKPTSEKKMLWRCEYPVRVMRHQRPEHQQIFLVPLPRVRN